MKPGHQDTWVNYHNDDRAPLLFISGGEDHLMPPSVQRANAKNYKSKNTLTEVKEFEGFAHFLPAQKGWEHDSGLRARLGREACADAGWGITAKLGGAKPESATA